MAWIPRVQFKERVNEFGELNSKKESGVSRVRKGLVSQHEKSEKEE